MAIEDQEPQSVPVDETEQTSNSDVESTEPEAISEVEQLAAEKAELLDHLKRSQAEFENIRRRLTREQEETREYAAMSTIDSLLPIVDDFERALETDAIDPEFLKGLELIRDRILDVFQRAGLEPIEAIGAFDPHHHQAVDRATAETDEADQTILDVYRKGYRFKDRLLRPAMVKVAVKD